MNKSAHTMQQIASAFAYPNKVEKETVAAVIRTKGEVILGRIHIRPVLRVIDELVSAEQFIAVTDARVYDMNGKILFQTKFLALNRDDITYLIPRDEMPDHDDEEDADEAMPS